MQTFKIATWNVNSLRVRLPHVLSWLAENKPDVLALQEIKMLEEDFPFADLQEIGYSAVVLGQKTYNGVAILSRYPLTETMTSMTNYSDYQCRLIAASLNDIRIINIYVPNGESVDSEKYEYKLTWLKSFHDFLSQQLILYPKTIVLGDLNIAPEEIDVYDPKEWEGSVLFSKPERDAFQSLLKIGFSDCLRLHVPNEKIFSWWDYRLNAFKRKMGLRIDHILASAALAKHCIRSEVDVAPRTWERPSDHAPVVAEFALK